MAMTQVPDRTLIDLRAITHEIGCALTNLAGAAVLLQSTAYEDPKAVERLQIVIDEVNRLCGLHARQREILQSHNPGCDA